MRKPVGILLISYFYIFGGVVLLLTIFSQHDDSTTIAERFYLPGDFDPIFRVLLALFSFIMVYGYLRLRKWGYWLMIGYSAVFACISLLLLSHGSTQPFIGNFVWSIVVLLYSIYVRESFIIKEG